MSFELIEVCDGSSSDSGVGGNGGGGDYSTLIQSIINNYIDNIVVDIYDLLQDRATALRITTENLESAPTAENLEAAREAWIL